MKLSEIKQILADRGIQLTKSLGQNFLHDQNVLRKIVASAELSPKEKVLEIGPGLGPLTAVLLEQGADVFAIEKDNRLHDFLVEQFRGNSNLQLLRADALDYLQVERRDWTDWKLVANLPYSVASPILVELAFAAGSPKMLVATLQLDVARRLMAKADEEDYSQLSLLVQVRYEPRALFKIAASCFFPAPDVDSGCIVLRRRPVPLLDGAQLEAFRLLIKRGFAQRRKMMFKLLKEYYPEHDLTRAFAELNISPQARAESVSLEQFVELTKRLPKAADKP